MPTIRGLLKMPKSLAVAVRSTENYKTRQQKKGKEAVGKGGCDAADVTAQSTLTMMFSKSDILKAMEKASRGHMHKAKVREMLADREGYCDTLLADIGSGAYAGKLEYRAMERTGNNGKQRKIMSPSLYTRVLQIAWIMAVKPLYDAHDNLTGLNCKEGCGITARERRKSVLHLLKHLMYDRRDLHYGLLIDQRRCYEHVTRKAFRRKQGRLVKDKWLAEFGMNVVFTPEGKFPVGTPSSPLAHHILMLDFDMMCHSLAPVVIRYADNVLLASDSKEDLQMAKWRIKNQWWYDLGIRAKRQDTMICSLSEGVDFCGYVVRRNDDKTVTDHDKGYTMIRRATEERIRKCNSNKSWASYYGMMMHADCYRLMTETEKNMRLQELSARARIDRKMDARIAAREFHGNYSCLIEAMELWERTIGREAMLPIEGAEVENQCGYIFKGSTNQINYIER